MSRMPHIGFVLLKKKNPRKRGSREQGQKFVVTVIGIREGAK
jgi:hypothetical protein